MKQRVSSDIPGKVESIIREYMELVDEAAPRLIEGFYIVGSLALGDFQDRQSDIDFVAVTASPLTSDQHVVLQAIHTKLDQHDTDFDGIYLTWAALGENPGRVSAAYSYEGEFHSEGAFEANPAVWRVLSQHGICIRGQPREQLSVWFDESVLKQWCAGNLNGYWKNLVGRWKQADLAKADLFAPDGLPWIVLGIPRLHYTIATAGVIAKSSAAGYAAATFGLRWQRSLALSAAHRLGQPIDQPIAASAEIWREGLSFAEQVIADANLLLGAD